MTTKTRELIIKEQFRLTDEETLRIFELNNLFFDGDHDYLRGKTLPAKYKREIDDLFRKYIYPTNNINWNENIYDFEMKDLKTDNFCNKNTNKQHWVKSYILSWLSNLVDCPSAESMFYSLTSRKANQLLISYVYEVK